MRIVVTGAAGFIGSSVALAFAKEGHEVIGLDNYSSYYSVALKELRVNHFLSPVGIECVKVDLGDYLNLRKKIKEFQPESIIHLAAQAGVRLPISQLNNYVDSNLIGYSNIAKIAVELEIPNFLYASSSSVYGNSADIPYSESEKKLNPSSYYGATKLFNEIATPTLIRNSNTRARGLRFFTVYGPWGRPDMAYFRMIANILTGSKFEFFGDGTIERDFTYVDDVSELVLQLHSELATRGAGENDVVNVGGGRPLSMNYLAETVAQMTGQELSALRLPGKKEDSVKTMADSQYLISLIGQKPETKLETGISKTVEWASITSIREQLKSWVASSI